MIRNRFFTLCLSLLALSATSAFAQEGKASKPGQDAKPGQRRGGAMSPKALTKALDLKPEQEEKLKPAFKKMTETRKSLADVTDPKEKRQKMMAATKELMQSVEDVLTPEQKVKFDEMKKKMEAGRKKKNGNK